jgi:hypothetical protein
MPQSNRNAEVAKLIRLLRQIRHNSWAIIQSLLWSTLVAVAAFAAVTFALVRTGYPYWVDNALSNGHGP